MARGRRTHVVGRSDRQPVWFGINLQVTTVPGASAILIGSLNAAALLLRPFTVVRTHILVSWSSDQVAASEISNGAFGTIVVSEQALAAGVASIPDPIGEADAPFFTWQAFSQQFLFADATGFESAGWSQYEIDSKAMRKVGNNEDIAFVATNAAALGGQIELIGRMLVKLH